MHRRGAIESLTLADPTFQLVLALTVASELESDELGIDAADRELIAKFPRNTYCEYANLKHARRSQIETVLALGLARAALEEEDEEDTDEYEKSTTQKNEEEEEEEGEASPPLLFLDVDGVLNRTVGATHIRLDADLVARFEEILARSGAQIVFSTFWREFDGYLEYALRRHGVTAVVAGRTAGTPTTSTTKGVRGVEIAEYLAKHHPRCRRYAILDDRAVARPCRCETVCVRDSIFEKEASLS